MKFRIKIMLSMAAVLAIAFGIGGSILIAISFSNSLERERSGVETSYRFITNTLHALNEVNLWEDAGDVADSLSYLMENQAQTFSGCYLYGEDAVYYIEGKPEETYRDLSDNADSGHYAAGLVESADGSYYLQLSGLLSLGSDTLHLDLLYDITSVYEARREQMLIFYQIYGVVVGVSLVLVWLISRLLTGSLMRLSLAAKELAKGNLSHRSGVDTDDEIGDLAREFDRMAAQLEHTIDELKDSMRRQEEFMGSFAHEMKTPMTSVIGYADLMRSDILSSEERIEAANYIFSEGKRLEMLSQKLLALFMLEQEAMSFSRVSPLHLIRELVRHLAPVYEESGINLEADGEEGSCFLEAELVQTLLVNLVDNARKALDHGGRIHLSCRMLEDGCLIRTEDNGRGIPPEALSHLTEAFYRVDKSRSRSQGGAGLGLTLCNKIAQLHDGELQIESELGKYTAVTVILRGKKNEEA